MGLRVLILGYGEMGHALEFLLAENHEVRIWSRSGNVLLEEEAACAQIILLCLPVNAHQEVIRRIAPHLQKDSLCLSIAKGIDESGMTAPQILSGVLAEKNQFGVVYGPMISEEIRQGRYAFADVALSDTADFVKIENLFQGGKLICRQVGDMSGSSWSVILKNVYAIIFGVSDGLNLGANMRGHLMVSAVSELSAIVKSFGAAAHTPFSYAGLGDLLTTATSENSHHHELGRKLATGQYENMTGEGIHTLKMVRQYQLFDYRAYPLFSLVSDLVDTPDKLEELVKEYFVQLQKW